MTDDQEFQRIVSHEEKRDNERRDVTKIIAAKAKLTPEQAAEVVRQLDSNKPGQLTMLSVFIPGVNLRRIWELTQIGKTSKRDTT